MKFEKGTLDRVWIISHELSSDERGYFTRIYCEEEFAKKGLPTKFPQTNLSYNKLRGTVRGMHYQKSPHGEVKVIRCSRGHVHDALVDLRPNSSTYLKVMEIDLKANSPLSLFVPEGIAHGFQTLEDDSEVFYMMGSPFVSTAASGVRWNDPSFKLKWPLPIQVISDRDKAFEDYNPKNLNRGDL
jgi:dTDP-4-dehydrorhamnose 3,5-epimerase